MSFRVTTEVPGFLETFRADQVAKFCKNKSKVTAAVVVMTVFWLPKHPYLIKYFLLN